MSPADWITLSNFLGGLPLHSLLVIAVVVLWRRTNQLQQDLDECLKKQ